MRKIEEASELKEAEKQHFEQLVAERTKALQEELGLIREMNIKLTESEKRFRIAQDISPDGFTILQPLRNEHGKIVDFILVYENQSIARINGTVPDEVKGKRLLELFPSHQGSSVFEAYIGVAESGNPHIINEVFIGEIVSVATWLRLVIVSLGGDIAILAQNITDRKHAEEKMSLQLHELERWHQVTLEREERVMELKREVNKLLVQTGRTPKYQSVIPRNSDSNPDDRNQLPEATE